MTFLGNVRTAIKSKLAASADKLFGVSQLFGIYSTDATAADDDSAVPVRVTANGALKVDMASSSGTVDVSDRAARAVGVVTGAAGAALALESGGNLASIVTKLAGGLAAALGSLGGTKVEEQGAPAAEDGTQGVIATVHKYVPSGGSLNVYCPDKLGHDFGTNVAATLRNVPAVVTGIIVANRNAALRYFQIHDKSTAPAAADVAALSIPVLPGTVLFLGADVLGLNGFRCALGASYAWSTAGATYTAGATVGEHDAVLLGKV